MSTTAAPHPFPRTLSAEATARLQESLKRCSPPTFRAACEYYRTGRSEHLVVVIRGIIERYVDRDFRARLLTSDLELKLTDDLGIDSLTMIEIVVLAEEVLNISVTQEDLAGLKTLGDVVRFAQRKTSTATG